MDLKLSSGFIEIIDLSAGRIKVIFSCDFNVLK